MEKMNTELASLQEIGKRLHEALMESGRVPREVMAAIDAGALTNWYRWISGETEGGCRMIAQAGLYLGLRPDQLLLKESGDDVLTVADEVALHRIRTLIVELTKIFNGDVRPAKMIAGQLQHLLDMARESAAGPERLRLPAGTVVSPVAGISGMKLYEPPQPGKKQKSKKFSAGEAHANFGVAEKSTKYGKKKKSNGAKLGASKKYKKPIRTK